MFTNKILSELLFFDIETAGQYKDYDRFKADDYDGAMIFASKCKRLGLDDLALAYTSKVSLFPEFGKIVCLSYGMWENGNMKISTIAETTESDTMKKIANLFSKASSKGYVPCGWNIKNFDLPWVFRKLLINGIKVPTNLNNWGKKPWEINAVDLKELWKAGSNLDCTFEEAVYSLGLPSPKDEMDGSQVHYHYWDNANIEGIKYYCEKDVRGMIHFCERLYMIYHPNDLVVNTLR